MSTYPHGRGARDDDDLLRLDVLASLTEVEDILVVSVGMSELTRRTLIEMISETKEAILSTALGEKTENGWIKGFWRYIRSLGGRKDELEGLNAELQREVVSIRQQGFDEDTAANLSKIIESIKRGSSGR